MAELADALDLGSSGISRAGSSPVIRTKTEASKKPSAMRFFGCFLFSYFLCLVVIWSL